VLGEQHQLIDDYRAQHQQLRAPQPFHRHRRAPLKDVLEQAIKRFKRLGTQLMEEMPHLYAVIVVGVRPRRVATNARSDCSHRWRISGA
jgi:hypothetical protein